MMYQSPYERQLARKRFLTRIAVLLGVVVVSLWLDGPVYRFLATTYEPPIAMNDGESTAAFESRVHESRSAAHERKVSMASKDWVQMLRAAGYVPTWLFIGGCVWLIDQRRQRVPSAGLTIILGAVFTGLAAELLKLAFGRHRPLSDGSLDWNPFLGAIYQPDPYGHALGLPSSHAAVAFGAAFVIFRLYPSAGWVAMAAAIGCGLTRLLAGAHVLSDVVVAAILAGAISSVLVRVRPAHDRVTDVCRFD